MKETKKSSSKLLGKPFEGEWANHEGDWVAVQDTESKEIFYAKIHLKAVTCGKANCHKCPHHIYAYARFRDGKRVRDKYLGVAR